MIDVTLFIKNEKGKLLDRFRDRLMFPLCDELGDPIAFSGRRISNDSQIAKYVNSQELHYLPSLNCFITFQKPSMR